MGIRINIIIFEHQKYDTTKINVESKTIVQSENNEQINSDEESDDPEKINMNKTDI